MRAPSPATIVRTIIFAALSIVIFVMAYPWIDAAIYALRLTLMPAPAALPMPVAGLTRKALNDTWHASRPPARRHEGIDIFARKGTPVVSTTEGIVTRTGETALGGHVVWVLGPGGQHHYYAHLDQPAVAAPRDRVRPGTLLGYVGNSGNARTTPAHLHYGVYTNAGPINPYPLLARPQAPSRQG